MNNAEALTELSSMVAAAFEPVLSAGELDELLSMCRLIDSTGNPPDAYEIWLQSTAYSAGAPCVPVTRNGYYYAVTVAGTSHATTEPAWPTTVGGTVVDGTVTWECKGTASWAWTWMLARGAAEGWRWKAAKVANSYDFSADGQSFSRSQMFQMCKDMAKMYAKKVTSNVNLPGQLSRLRSVYP